MGGYSRQEANLLCYLTQATTYTISYNAIVRRSQQSVRVPLPPPPREEMYYKIPRCMRFRSKSKQYFALLPRFPTSFKTNWRSVRLHSEKLHSAELIRTVRAKKWKYVRQIESAASYRSVRLSREREKRAAGGGGGEGGGAGGDISF